MAKNFDFANITLKVIDINMGTTPEMFVNQTNISFGKRTLEDMDYPTYVQYCVDAENAIFAVRTCKGTESRAVPFVKDKSDLVKTLTCTNKNVHEVITRLIPDYQPKKRYKIVGHYDSENRIMYYDLRDAAVSMFYREDKE